MIHKTTIFAFFLLTFSTFYGQVSEPLDLAKKIFNKEGFPDMSRYISGEYKGKPNGKDLKNDATTTFRVLKQSEKSAVVAMTILDPQEKGFDAYLYFEKKTSWKMTAFRSLAMTGMIEGMLKELERMSPQQVDKMIEDSTKKDSFALFTSKEDYNFQLGNAKLILELDENIIQHFLKNQAEFEQLKNLALNELQKNKKKIEIGSKLIEDRKTDYQKLFISSVSAGEEELGDGIIFLIGGMLDNSVGYLYVKDKKDVPEITPDKVIMLQEIGNGWYIYKTT